MPTTQPDAPSRSFASALALLSCAALLSGAACNESVPSSSSSSSSPERRGARASEAREAEQPALPAPSPSPGTGLVYEGRSEYSHFRIIDRGDTRYLMFVRDNGVAVVESGLRLSDPDRLAIEYTRVMFVSHLLRPEQERVLIVGLGGGSMVRFLRRFFPDIEVTAIDIDPAIVDAAREYFGIVSGPNLDVRVADGFAFLRAEGVRYDVVYMDAFLRPGPETDDEGAPLNMQTLEFLNDVKARLVPGGMLVVNINVTDDTENDIAVMRQAFPQVYLFEGGGNLIAVGSTAPEAVTQTTMRRNGRRIDRRGEYGFSFEGLADRITER